MFQPWQCSPYTIGEPCHSSGCRLGGHSGRKQSRPSHGVFVARSALRFSGLELNQLNARIFSIRVCVTHAVTSRTRTNFGVFRAPPELKELPSTRPNWPSWLPWRPVETAVQIRVGMFRLSPERSVDCRKKYFGPDIFFTRPLPGGTVHLHVIQDTHPFPRNFKFQTVAMSRFGFDIASINPRAASHLKILLPLLASS